MVNVLGPSMTSVSPVIWLPMVVGAVTLMTGAPVMATVFGPLRFRPFAPALPNVTSPRMEMALAKVRLAPRRPARCRR